APGPGEWVDAAETFAGIGPVEVNLVLVADSKPPVFRLVDNMIVRITHDSKRSWRATWIQSKPKAVRERLLHHEQRHYDIAALIGRDFFLELMQLKRRTYENQAALQRDLETLNSSIRSKAQAVQNRYDEDTEHGKKQDQQDRWDKMIEAAGIE